jgi:hypothetical protein
MLTKALFSSERHDWETPTELFDELDAKFGYHPRVVDRSVAVHLSATA